MPFWKSFHDLKLYLVDISGLGKDALHIYIGLAIFITIRLLWRRRGGWVLAWVVVLIITLWGEYLDIQREEAGDADVPFAWHWHDIWNTMFWPTMLLILGRWLQPHAAQKPNAAIANVGQDTDQHNQSNDIASEDNGNNGLSDLTDKTFK